jgi:LCP family protein required for cell wall assembly
MVAPGAVRLTPEGTAADDDPMSSAPTPRRGVGPCCAAALASAVLPGLGHQVVRAKRGRLLAGVAAVNVVASSMLVGVLVRARSRAGLVALVADRRAFLAVAALLVVLAQTRLWSAADSAWQARPTHGGVARAGAAVAASVLVAVGVAPLAVAADVVWTTDQAVSDVFASEDAVTAMPSPVIDDPISTDPDAPVSASPDSPATSSTLEPAGSGAPQAVPSTQPTVPPTPAPTTTLPPIVGENRVNVLLLGGDAGADRWSLRTDSMVLVSIDPITGDTVMISVPRNLTRLPFPTGTPLAERYPRGFTDLANAVYPIVDLRRELAGGGEDAGAQAIKQGIAQLVGMPVHYYVLVDMAGFVDVIDALGGIQLDVRKRVPTPGNPPGSKHPVPPYIEVGEQQMDGTLALAYARSRTADSDYQRMERQRCVLAGIAAAATPRTVATGITDLMTAFGSAVRTDIPRERLPEIAALIERFSAAGGLSAVRTLHLAPPLVNPRSWNAVKVRTLVSDIVVASASTVAPPVVDPATAPPPSATGALRGC